MPKVAAIVYGEQSGIVRRIVVSDSIEELGRGRHYGDGESLLIVRPDEVVKFDPQMKRSVPALDECYALVAEKRGKPSDSDRCIVIGADGEIEKVVLADPSVSADRAALAGKTLFQHARADIGWVLDDRGEFVSPVLDEPSEIAPDGEAR